jgi:hypothetical protein
MAVGGVAFVGIIASAFALPSLAPVTYERTTARAPEEVRTEDDVAASVADTREVVKHVPLPDPMRSIYMTSCVLGTKGFREELVGLIDRTEINSVVIDIKDYSGTISFPPKNELLRPAWQAAKCGSVDTKEFIASLHEKGIYVIGRITVFQDPLRSAARPDLAVKKASDGSVWRDHKGLSFIDVSARDHWDYTVALAEEAYELGYDELNFDYVRFPSDGNMKDIAFTHTGNKTKPEALESFFDYLHAQLSDPERFADKRHENTGRATTTPYLSVDIFGMTTTNTDDLSIGQVLERTLPYFDFVAPMVYPSHYPPGFMGLADPNDHVYKVVHHAMGSAVRRATATTTTVAGALHERIGTSTPPLYQKPVYSKDKLRPWIQDFDYGGDYGPYEVRAQIQAGYDAGLQSYMVWAPSNRYTEAAFHN